MNSNEARWLCDAGGGHWGLQITVVTSQPFRLLWRIKENNAGNQEKIGQLEGLPATIYIDDRNDDDGDMKY